MKDNIDIDLRNNIIAKWHDESQINRYILDRNDYKELSDFCEVEGWPKNENAAILIKDKSKYFDVDKFKKKTLFQRFKTYVRKTIQKIK